MAESFATQNKGQKVNDRSVMCLVDKRKCDAYSRLHAHRTDYDGIAR